MPALSDEYCLLWINWWAACLTKSEWASWVQAIGSVLALGVAGWAVWFQVRRAAEHAGALRVEEEVKQLQILSGVLASLFFHLTFYRWDREAGEQAQHDRIALRRQSQQLERLNLWQLPDWEAWHGAELAQHAANVLVDRLDDMDTSRMVYANARQLRENALNEAEVNFVEAMHGITSALARRGAKHVQISFKYKDREVRLTEAGELQAK